MKKTNLLYAALLVTGLAFFWDGLKAQKNVGIGTNSPDASAALDVTSPAQGILIPRMGTTARTAINSPAPGLVVYDSTIKSFYYYDGAAWQQVGAKVLPAQTGNAGKVLTTDGSDASWQLSGLAIVSQAARTSLSSPALGTTVYQIDGYPGIYSYQFDGWRCMSGETPITTIDLGVDTTSDGAYSNPNNLSLPIVLDASYHTIYVTGDWSLAGMSNARIFRLPDPAKCKGRIYKFVLNNRRTVAATNTYVGDWLRLQSTDFTDAAGYSFRRLTNGATGTTFSSGKLDFKIPDGRMFVLQSNGIEWLQIQDDVNDQANY